MDFPELARVKPKSVVHFEAQTKRRRNEMEKTRKLLISFFADLISLEADEKRISDDMRAAHSSSCRGESSCKHETNRDDSQKSTE